MDWPKAKTIIIVLLLVVNIFLLATYVMRENDERKDELSLRDNVSQILENQGIEVPSSVLPLDSMEIRPSTVKSVEDTEKLAKRLLADVTQVTQGESVVYSSENGNIMFLKDSFSFVYEHGKEIVSADEAVLLAEEIADKLGVSTSRGMLATQDSVSGYTVKIPQVFSAIPIFGSDIEIKISKNGSVIGSGKFIGRGSLGHTEGKTFAPSAIMIKFADGIRAREINELKVSEISYGYIASTPVGGVVPLVPTMRVKTDKGDFYVNMTDGTFAEI